MSSRRPGYDIYGQPTRIDPRDFPDPLTIEPEWQAEAEAALAEHRRVNPRHYTRDGCGPAVLLLLVLAALVAAPFMQARVVDRGALADGRRILTSGVATAEPGQEGSEQPRRGPTGTTTGRGGYSTTLATVADVSYSGIVNYAEPGLGRYYLAIPDGKGVRVEICGPSGCLIRTSTDAGPALHMQRAGRIADLNSVDWQEISGVPLRLGGFQGTILILDRPALIALPQTDTQEER